MILAVASGCQKKVASSGDQQLACNGQSSCDQGQGTTGATTTDAGTGTGSGSNTPGGASSGITSANTSANNGGVQQTASPLFGFERYSYQTRSIKRLITALDLGGADAVNVTINTQDYSLEVIPTFSTGFSSLKNATTGLSFADQDTINQVLQYGANKMDLSLSEGGQDLGATNVITLTDSMLFDATGAGNFMTDASLATGEANIESWTNTVGYPDATGGGRSYSSDLLLLTGFFPMVNY